MRAQGIEDLRQSVIEPDADRRIDHSATLIGFMFDEGAAASLGVVVEDLDGTVRARIPQGPEHRVALADKEEAVRPKQGTDSGRPAPDVR